MRSRHVAHAALVALLLLPVSACSEDSPTGSGAVGTSELAPENHTGKPGKDGKRADRAARKAQKRAAGRVKAKHAGKRARPAAATDAARPAGRRSRDADTDDSPSTAGQNVSDPTSASVSDPAGDVRGTLTGAPAYADLTGATLTRGDAFEVRVSFAGAVPQRQTDDRIVQVATFYDLDGDGETDYEVWASLADDGWGTSYRTPSGARFGEDSGARVRPEGNVLVITFPLSHLDRADALAWAVGAQWGTVEQVASGTTSKDNAPDGGWAGFPR